MHFPSLGGAAVGTNYKFSYFSRGRANWPPTTPLPAGAGDIVGDCVNTPSAFLTQRISPLGHGTRQLVHGDFLVLGSDAGCHLILLSVLFSALKLLN